MISNPIDVLKFLSYYILPSVGEGQLISGCISCSASVHHLHKEIEFLMLGLLLIKVLS